MRLWITLFILVAMCSLNVNAMITPKVVYGDDDRVDFYNAPQVYQELALSTAAMIASKRVVDNGNGFDIVGNTLQKGGICKDARFSQQITAASCTGFLVGEDLVVTAGHCIRNQYACDSNKWVFDFAVKSADQSDYKVEKSSVYNCVKIIDQVLDNSNKDDYALIQLDRPVTGRQPLKYRKSGTIGEGASLVVIGHPSGLPAKVADGAFVRNIAPSKFFVANLDTFGGNSGSPVFNADTLEIEGILVRGEADYTYDYGKTCRVPKVCKMDSCRGEDVTRITNIPALQ